MLEANVGQVELGCSCSLKSYSMASKVLELFNLHFTHTTVLLYTVPVLLLALVFVSIVATQGSVRLCGMRSIQISKSFRLWCSEVL